MEEETVASKDVTVIHVAASTEVSDGKKGDEETSLSMELEPNSVTEPSCAEAPSNEELMAVQKSSKRKKKMAAQEKMRALEFDNVQLKEKVTEAEQQLDALQAQLTSLLSEHKELSGIKEAYDSLYLELERSRENTKDHSLQDDIHTPREEELERLLEEAKMSAKDAKDRILSLQDELEGLHERMMEKEKLEESLMSATLELSAREIRVKEMYEELELLRTSERQLKGDLLESEALLFSTRNELQAKVSEVEAAAAELTLMKEEFAKVDGLAADAVTRNSKLAQKLKPLEELHEEFVAAEASSSQKNIELEGLLQAASDATRLKLQESEAKFEAAVQKNMELESALSQSLALKHELEAELDKLVKKCVEHDERRANAAHEDNLELEELVRFSYSKVIVEDSDRRASELESLLETQRSKMNDLENALEVVSEKEKESETEKERMEFQVQELRVKIAEMESALNQSFAIKFELEAELKELSDRYAEREGRANAIHERNQELEELVQSSHYRIEDSDRRVTELELLLEAQKSRSNYLEQVIETLEEKCRYAETELVKHSDMVYTLTIELQSANTTATDELKKLDERCAEHERRANATHELNLELEDLVRSLHYRIEESKRRASELEFLLDTQKSRTKDLEQDIDSLVQNFEQAEAKSTEYADTVSTLMVELEKSCLATSRLENALEAAAVDERQLTEEKGKSEEALHDSLAKLQEAENLLGLLHNELIATQGKLESVENDLKAAGIAEIEITEKLESAEFQLQQQRRVLEEATGKTAKLESLNAILTKDTELKFQELMEKFTNKDSEVKSLYEKLQILEDQIKDYEDQAAEAGFKVAAMTEELNHSCTKLASLESLNEELKQTVVDAESKSAESQLMLNDLQENLSSALAEKDYAVERFENSLKATEDLRQELLSDRQSFQNIIASIMEEKRLLGEANAIAENELQTSITELDRQLKEYKESNATLNVELENLKLQATDNSALQSRVNDLEEQLMVTEAQFKKERASIMEEKRLLGEANKIAENELQTKIIELDRQLKEYKESNGALNAELENLKLQATDNSALQIRVSELEEQLLVNEAQFKKEICSIMEEKKLHDEANRVAQIELQTSRAQLEEQFYEYKKGNDALHTELENLKLQATDNSTLQSRVSDLEEQLLFTEAQFKKERASIMEEKQLRNEANRVAQNELQTLIAQLEEQLYQYKKRNGALQAELENTKLQAIQYNASQTRVKELEEPLLASEGHFKKEVEYIQAAAAAAREVELTSMLEQQIQKVRDEDDVNEKVQHLEEVLVFPPTANIELKEENTKLEIFREKGDIGANISTAKERKMKTPGNESKQANEEASSPLKNIKIAFGVGLVSIIAGMLAGNK